MPPSFVIHRTGVRAHRLVLLPFATSGGSRATVVATSRAARERLRAALHRHRVAKTATGGSPAECGHVVGLHA
jgi:hypothetical protein